MFRSTCLILMAALAIAPMAAAGTIRILPLGDSITRGISNGQGGYRPLLQAKLASMNFNAGQGGFEFVGPYPTVDLSPDTNAGSGWSSTPPAGTDLDHYGYAGRSFGDYARTTENGEGDRATFQQRLAAYPADIVLLHLGTNDVNWRETGNSSLPAGTITTLRGYVDSVLNDIYSANPQATILLARIIGDARTSPSSDLERNDRIVQFNTQIIDDVVADRQLLGQKIIPVDMYSAVPRNGTYYSDGVHPTTAGYQKMADAWSSAMVAVPEPSITLSLSPLLFTLLARRRNDRASHV